MPLLKVVYEDSWQKVFDLPFLPREKDILYIGRLPGRERVGAEVQFLGFYLQEGTVVAYTDFWGDEKEETAAFGTITREIFFTERGWEKFSESEVK